MVMSMKMEKSWFWRPWSETGGIPEGEADEETGDGAEHGFGVEVGWGAPVLGEDSPGDFAELGPKGFGEFEKCGGVVVNGSALEFSLHIGQNFSNLGLFERVPPFISPVDGVGGTRRCPNDVQHPFGRVLLSATFPGTVALKVACQCGGVPSNVSKVDCAPSRH